MAERPSVKDILAAARRAGAAKPEEAAAPEPSPEAADDATPLEVSSAPEPPVTPAAAPEPLGRPLTLKEKLAAARSGAAPAPPAAAPAPRPAAAAAPAPAAEAPAERAVPEAPAPIGRPLSLKEKLAAARGAGTAPAAPAAGGAKPAAAKPAAAPAAKAAPAAARALPPLEKTEDPRDLAEHLRRAGVEKEKAAKATAAAKAAEAAGATPSKAAAAGKSAATKKVESKVVPPKPDKGAALARSQGDSRRDFLLVTLLTSWVVIGWVTFTAAVSAATVMCVRFLFPNVLAEPPSTIKVGLPTNFELGEVNERWKAEWGFWIVRSNAYNGSDTLYALQSVCTHLGCPPNWLGGEQKFKCPCHGSGFYISGVNFEGPAPRPLERFKVSLADDGQVVVDKSQKFQEELQQWSDPDSFIPMA